MKRTILMIVLALQAPAALAQINTEEAAALVRSAIGGIFGANQKPNSNEDATAAIRALGTAKNTASPPPT